MQASDKKPPEQGYHLLGAWELLAQSSATSSSAGGAVDVAAANTVIPPAKAQDNNPVQLIWGTRLCQASFCRDGWIQREFCLVLMEPLNNELANFHSRLINAP